MMARADASARTVGARGTERVRLGIDAREICAARPRGTGKALTALFQHLLPLVPDWAVTLYTNRVTSAVAARMATTRLIDPRGDRFNTWERVALPWAAWSDRVSILHCPAQSAPPFATCPIVLTVHDVIPLRMDDGWPARAVCRFRRQLARDARSARRIITISEFVKQDFLALFPIPEAKIDVIPWGVGPPYDPVAPRGSDASWQDLERQFGLRGPFFLAFGGDSPRKNIPGLLRALAAFTRTVSTDVQLVVVGVPSSARSLPLHLAEEFGVVKHLILADYVADDVVVFLLRRAEALVYPSLYEGFGLPILEAMALGTSVITSNVTAMPEIAGDAALLVDPSRPEAIADAMRDCYLNAATKEALRARGLRRAAHFRWQDAAAATVATYRRALGLETA